MRKRKEQRHGPCAEHDKETSKYCVTCARRTCGHASLPTLLRASRHVLSGSSCVVRIVMCCQDRHVLSGSSCVVMVVAPISVTHACRWGRVVAASSPAHKLRSTVRLPFGGMSPTGTVGSHAHARFTHPRLHPPLLVHTQAPIRIRTGPALSSPPQLAPSGKSGAPRRAGSMQTAR